jgi:hypothetical protein
MKIISHRGNVNGPNVEFENSASYIESAIKLGFDVEVDIWKINNELYLGHDMPQYKVTLDWIINYYDCLWVHCKNIEAFVYFKSIENKENRINFFWHENDTLTLTSLGYIWAFPGKQPIHNSIGVLPELFNDELDVCSGICTDYPYKFKKNESI